MAERDLLLSYAAGVIDSDGCITLQRRTRPSPQRHYYACRIRVAQITPQAVETLAELFGGTVLKVHRSDGGRPLYTWDVCSRRAVEVCRQLLPFLRIKPRQAELVARAGELNAETIAGQAIGFSGQLVRSVETEDELEEILSEIRVLNGKGPKA